MLLTVFSQAILADNSENLGHIVDIGIVLKNGRRHIMKADIADEKGPECPICKKEIFSEDDYNDFYLPIVNVIFCCGNEQNVRGHIACCDKCSKERDQYGFCKYRECPICKSRLNFENRIESICTNLFIKEDIVKPEYLHDIEDHEFITAFNSKYPLLEAIKLESLPLFEYFLQRTRNVNEKYMFDMSAIHVAAEIEDYGFEMCKLLIKCGADVNAMGYIGWTPLHLAAQAGSMDTVRFLIDNGAKVYDSEWNGKIETPLHMASEDGHCDVVEYLLKNGANVNARNLENSTPLHSACDVYFLSDSYKENHLKAIRILIDNGADLNAKDYENKTPLDIARVGDIRNLLLSYMN